MDPVHTFDDDGVSTPFTVKSRSPIVAASGDWGTGELTIEVSFDGGTRWIPLSNPDGTTFTASANFVRALTLAPCKIRFELDDSTSPDLDIFVA